MRLFFGVPVPAELAREIGAWTRSLQAFGIRAANWSRPDLYHVTVLFLGELPPAAISQLDAIGRRAAAQVAPFRLRFAEVGAFAHNRVLWLGLADDEGMAALQRLHVAVRAGVADARVAAVDPRPFRAHMTLARQLDVAHFTALTRQARGWNKMADVTQTWAMDVPALCLFASTREGGRLTYPVVAMYPLSGLSHGGDSGEALLR